MLNGGMFLGVYVAAVTIVNSKRLEHGGRMIYAELLVSVAWGRSSVMFIFCIRAKLG